MTQEEVEKRRDKYYIRVYMTDDLLNGVSSYLTETQHAVWFKIRMLCANHSPPGTLSLYPDQKDPYIELAKSLKTKPATLKATLDKLQRRGKVNIQDNLIIITNWDRDQPQLQLRFPGKEYDGVGEKKRRKPAPETTALKKPSQAETVNRAEKQAWQIAKDIERDALEWFSATGEAFAKLQEKYPIEYQQKLGDFKRQYPDKFRK